jgi:hypothetical protein
MPNAQKTIAALVIVVAVAVAFLSLTKPGHQVLYKIGIASACGSSDGCN